jgi:hypothetical protein
MVRGWQRVLLLVIAFGVFIALASPFAPDPLSIPGKNVVVFAVFLMVTFFAHALLVQAIPFSSFHEAVERNTPDRLALICERIC